MTTSAPLDGAETPTGPRAEGDDHGGDIRSNSSTDQTHLIAEDVLPDGTVQDDDDGRPRASADTGDSEESENEQQGAESVQEYIDRYLRSGDMSKEDHSSHQANTQFLEAAKSGDIEALRDKQGDADSDAKNEFSETALHLACRFGHVEIVEELLGLDKHNKTIETRDNDNWTPLLSACSRYNDGTLEIIELLFKHCELNTKAKSDVGYTALHLASLTSSADVIGYLLKKGSDPEATDAEGDTPLNLACQSRGTLEIKEFLGVDSEVNVKAKTWINTPNEHGSTPLTVACECQSAEIVHLLLENNANCNVEDSDGDTPLILASRFGNAKMVEDILKRKPQSWAHENENHEHALTRAMMNTSAREEIIPLLLNRGLQFDDQDALEIFSRGNLDRVSEFNMQQSVWLKMVQDMLKSNNSPPDKPLREAIGPILKFASKEEKVYAIINADTKEHFDVLMELTEELRLSKDVSAFTWARRRGTKSDLDSCLEALKRRQAKSTPELMPTTPLQWSAYYGEHNLAWCLLRESQKLNIDDVKKAQEIAEARKPKRRIKGNKATVPADSDKDKEKSNTENDRRRYENTINILNNAPSLASIPKKQLMRPSESYIKGKEPLLRPQCATIVSLYERDGKIDLLQSAPSIFDLVYSNDDGGLNAIMEMARSTFDEMTNPTLDERVPRKDLKLRWIHLPANCMDWMEHLTLRIHDARDGYGKKSEDDEYLESFMDLAQRSQNELPTDKSDFKFMKPICLREVDRVITKEKTCEPSETLQGDAAVGSPRLALYTPYVTFGHCYPSDKKLSNQKNADLQAEYKGRIFHGPRSLDRFYYNTLPSTEMNDRDMSQVITRGLLNLDMGKSLPDEIQKWPYLTVGQLWVWVIDDETIISSSTHREDGFDNLLVNKIFDQLTEDSQKSIGQKPPSSATEMSQFLVSTCVDFIHDMTWKDVCHENEEGFDDDARSKPILLWYAESLNDAAAEEKKLFADLKKRIEAEETKRTKAQEKKSKKKAEAKQAEMALTEGQSLVSEGQEASQDESTNGIDPNTDEQDWTAIKVAATLLDEVKDIRDELVILRFLVAQQERVWEGLMGPKMARRDARSPFFIAQELDDMIKMTDTIQSSIKDLLNLNLVDKSAEQSETLVELGTKSQEQSDALIDLGNKSQAQSQALLDLGQKSQEQNKTLVLIAMKSQQQNDQNARQGKILLVFTVVTVIFVSVVP